MKVTRRQVLKGMTAAIGTAAVGCGGGATPGAPDAGTPSPTDAQQADAAVSADASPVDAAAADGAPADGAPADAAAADGASVDGGTVAYCEETSALTPAELLAPIDTIVVLCMENRSFDHYFGALKLVEGRAVDGLTGLESNLTAGGVPVPVHLLDDFTPADPPHGWDACHAQWNLGANDGFVTEHAGPSETDVMGYHVRAHLPTLYELADNFALCDRWFASVLGPTWPNRFYLHGGSANGNTGNTPAFGFDSIFTALDDAGVSNRNYYHDVAWASGAYFKFSGLAGIETFFTEAAAGTLPSYCLIDPHFFGAGANDDHPDHDISLGQALIASIYAALAASPQWGRCLFVVTYDEHGGFYDHVAPPTTVDAEPGFEQLGIRVPAIVAGPYVRPGCTISTVFEHTSVVSTLTRRFGLTPLNARVDATADLSSCLSPTLLSMPRTAPPLTPVPVSMSRLLARGGRPDPSHPEIAAAANLIPRHLDRRADSMRITQQVLAAGVRLGAVRLVR